MYRKRIGSILGRMRPLDHPYYCIDFTMHENDYDSDDENDDWQWKFPIRFSYERIGDSYVFLNKNEIDYDTRERYTNRIFWKNESTSIIRVISDTVKVRSARGEPIPFSESKICRVADDIWYKYISK